ncbi:hypothetical protein SBADM41S_08728 [Streptomyces badius]
MTLRLLPLTESTVPVARSLLPSVHFRRIIRVPDLAVGAAHTLPPVAKIAACLPVITRATAFPPVVASQLPGSLPASGGPTPAPPRSGTPAPTRSPGPCASSRTGSSTARACPGSPPGSATPPARSNASYWPSWAPDRWPWPAPSGHRPPACSSRRPNFPWPRWRSPPASLIRTFNETVREVFALAPGDLRTRAARSPRTTAVPGVIALRLPYRAPLNPSNLFGHLAATAVPGVEEWRDGAYRRTLTLPYGHGVVALTPKPDHIACRLSLTDPRDLTRAISRCRWLLDLDADPVAVDAQLRTDPLLAPLVDAGPGRRVPRTVDGAEFAVRAVLGRQVSAAAARTHAARLVTAHGVPVDDPEGGLAHLFPTPQALAELDPEALALPRTRRTTLTTLVAALAEDRLRLDTDTDWERARAELAALPGFGPWTVESIAMRSLGDPDAFLPTDLGIRRAAERLGLRATPAALTARAADWRPWRAYAVQYLWTVDDHPINHLPA